LNWRYNQQQRGKTSHRLCASLATFQPQNEDRRDLRDK
jgi:hypothetical protein